MPAKRVALVGAMAALFGSGYALGRMDLVREVEASPTPAAQAADRVFELRTYTAPEGKLDDLLERGPPPLVRRRGQSFIRRLNQTRPFPGLHRRCVHEMWV